MNFSSKSTPEQLLSAFEALNQQKNAQNILLVETKKLQIIQAIEAALNQAAPLPFPIYKHVEEKPDSGLQKIIKKTVYYLLLAFGIFEDAANSYFFGSSLFVLIPGITDPMLLIASIGYALLESTLFYLFDAYELRDALGIQDYQTKSETLIALYSQQLKLSISLNQHLLMYPTLKISPEKYKEYIRCVVAFNQDLHKKYDVINSRHNTLGHQILKISVFAFGAISSLAGSYFMAVFFISMMAPAFLGTPLGLGVILLIMLTGLVFHFAMDTTSMTRVVNPNYEKQNTLKQELGAFKEAYSIRADQFFFCRPLVSRKHVREASTQTDFSCAA